MADLYGGLYRGAIGRLDAERAHNLALKSLRRMGRTPGGQSALKRIAPEQDERLRLRVWNLPFANPLGVAAGLDKNAIAVEPLIALGFGHVEAGTVTLFPQAGNDRPRVWRVPESDAVINAMGFPNDGAARLRHQLLPLRPHGVIGVNIGKNKETSAERAAAEYASLLEAVFEVAQYITINVSSPNTPGLRSLQMADELATIMALCRESNERMGMLMNRDPKPLLVKIAPDLTDAEIEGIADAAVTNGIQGIVATNTTINRDSIGAEFADYPGGLSGAPLKERANHVVRVLYRRIGEQVPIIGVGGIASGADAVERIRSGATLVQLYTSFVYAGPALPGRILRDISADADKHGWRSITDIVGADVR